jgi:hypothetical protein
MSFLFRFQYTDVALVKIKELEEELPNGFQDAMVSSYTFLEEERRVEIELAVWVGDLWGRDEIGWERYAKARLELLNVLQWEPEAPHPQPYGPLTRSLRIGVDPVWWTPALSRKRVERVPHVQRR